MTSTGHLAIGYDHRLATEFHPDGVLAANVVRRLQCARERPFVLGLMVFRSCPLAAISDHAREWRVSAKRTFAATSVKLMTDMVEWRCEAIFRRTYS
jgi:hypothetical protein